MHWKVMNDMNRPDDSNADFDLEDLKRQMREAVMGASPKMSMPRMEGKSGMGWLWAIPVVIVLMTFARSFIVVGAGERAVIFNQLNGLQRGQINEGLHLLLPFVQKPTIYDVKTQTYTMSGSQTESNPDAGAGTDSMVALTADGLPVALEMSVQFHPDPENVWKLHGNIGPQYLEKIVRPQTRSHVRMVISKYPVVDVYGGRRAKIIEEINARLRERFAQNYIVLENALLRDVSFSTEFQQAIEQKQVAQQEVQKMIFVVQQADKERKRKIIEAEGEAESIRLKASALAENPQLTQYEYVKNLPAGVKTIITDGRTIVNLGDTASANNVVATDAPPPAQSQPQSTLGGP